MADARLQPHRTRDLGRRPYSERPLRPALHLRDVRHGAVLHSDGDRYVSVALEASGHSAPIPLHGISLVARDLRADWHSMDAEHHHHAPERIASGHGDCAAGHTRLSVLEEP